MTIALLSHHLATNAPIAKYRQKCFMTGFLRSLGLLCLGAFILLPLQLYAQAPGWWYNQGAASFSSQSNDYAPLNQGQLKSLAKAAAAELDAHWPGGAGGAVHQLVNGWNAPSAGANDYATVNLGQLKNTAKPFYDRLIAIGYASAYPWTNPDHPPTDFALANIGQAKNLFAFDLLKIDPADTNGLPDWWEHSYFPGQPNINPNALAARGDGLTIKDAFSQGLNPNDFFNGHAPVLAKLSGDNQTGSPDRYLPAALAVSVSDAGGTPLANAPVTFTVSSGGGQLKASSGASLVATLATRTNAIGQAKAFFKLPDLANETSTITVSAVGNNQAAPVTFTALSNNGTGKLTKSPFAPTHFVAILNDDGSTDMTWENHTDAQTPVEIKVEQPDGSYQLVATLAPGTTSYHLPRQPQ